MDNMNPSYMEWRTLGTYAIFLFHNMDHNDLKKEGVAKPGKEGAVFLCNRREIQPVPHSIKFRSSQSI